MIDIRIQAADFDPGKQLERLANAHPAAVASLTTFVDPPGDMAEILVDHYPAMAKEVLARIAAEAAERWPLVAVILVHRHGRLARGDRLVFIAAAAADRVTAADACGYLTRELSRRAPFWRRDVTQEDVGRSGRGERLAP